MNKRAGSKNKKKSVSLVSAMIILSMLLSSCGGSANPGGTQTGETGAETAEETAQESAEETMEAGNQEGTAEAGITEETAETGTQEETAEADEPEDAYRELTQDEILALYEPADEKVTLMVYMTGSDLESAAAAGTNDMQEMAQSGIDLSRVNLLIYTGGAPMWHSEDPEIPEDANALYHLTENGYEQVETFDQLSMGDPASLTRFLQYAYDNYPADSFDLILWDHGNGPVIGYGSDKQYGGDSLTLVEMREALEASPFGADNHLAMIGFDACLMSSAELANTMADYADYMVASQETEPSFGWNYDFLGVCGRISTMDLAREIVREYNVFCRSYFVQNEFFQSDITLAVIDLSYAKELAQAIDALFLEASGDVSGDYAKLAVARVHTHGFGRASTGSEYDLVDIESLAKQMEERYPENVQKVREAVEKAVVTSESNIGDSCGLSLFYPYYNKNYYKKTWKEVYQALDVFPSYSDYLSRFDQVWLGTDLLSMYEDELLVQKGEGAGTFTMQLTPEQEENFASARYYILRRISDNLYTVVYLSGDVTNKKGLLTANFDGNVIYFSDNYDTKGIPFARMYETVDGVTDYVATTYAERPPEDPDEWLNERLACEIQFAVDAQAKEVTIKGIYEDNEDESAIETGKKQPVDLSQWAQLTFYEVGSRYLTRDEKGRVLPFIEWPQSDWISYYELPLSNGLHFTYEPLYDDGNEYYIMFEVSDVQDNKICSELLPISLAEAPPEELIKEAVEVEWKGSSSVELFNEEGVRAEICVLRDTNERKTAYMLHTVNENDFGISIYLNDIYVNDTISYRSVGRRTETDFLDPGEERYREIEDIGVICNYASIAKPDTLQFTVKVKRTDNYGYLIYNRPYHVTVSEDVEPADLCIPVLGALAQEQVLAEENGVRTEVLQIGRFIGTGGLNSYYNEFMARFKFTNISEEEATVFLAGLEINGVYFDQLQMCILDPGQSWLVNVAISGDYLRQIDTNYVHSKREDLLYGISDIKVVTAANGIGYTYPVELAEKGDQEMFRPQGETVYEDEKVRIMLDSSGRGTGYDSVEGCWWELWVENKSDHYSSYYVMQQRSDGSSKYRTFSKLGFDSCQLVQLWIPQEEITEEEITVFLQNDNEGVPATDTFTLQIPQ